MKTLLLLSLAMVAALLFAGYELYELNEGLDELFPYRRVIARTS